MCLDEIIKFIFIGCWWGFKIMFNRGRCCGRYWKLNYYIVKLCRMVLDSMKVII